MSIDPKRYPADWSAISKRIRFERAGNQCEWCGVKNHVWVYRKRGTAAYLVQVGDEIHTPDGRPIRMSELPDGYNYDKPTWIVLSVAHLGTPHEDGRPGDKRDKMDCRDENLASLCQKCHLLYDTDERVASRRVTMIIKRRALTLARGQRTLFEEVAS